MFQGVPEPSYHRAKDNKETGAVMPVSEMWLTNEKVDDIELWMPSSPLPSPYMFDSCLFIGICGYRYHELWCSDYEMGSPQYVKNGPLIAVR